MTRFIQYKEKTWKLIELSKEYGIAHGTLSNRLYKFGENELGVERALTTGIQTKSQAGKKSSTRGHWKTS